MTRLTPFGNPKEWGTAFGENPETPLPVPARRRGKLQEELLDYLSDSQMPATPEELADVHHVTLATVKRALKALREKGLTEVEHERYSLWFLTNEGRTAVSDEEGWT